MIPGLNAAGWVLLSLAGLGAVYGLIAAILVRHHLAGLENASNWSPPVTLLKPLHGDHGALADNLASFLDQAHDAPTQYLFGVGAVDDPAAKTVVALGSSRRDRETRLLIDERAHGSNRKVANLINLAEYATHRVLIVSDADIRVPAGYLRAVLTALEPGGVGAVTCLYTGEGRGGFWSRLAAMDIDYRFLPNAVFGARLGLAHPCFGSTIALRAETLARIGGFAAFKDVLADDYEIGRAVRAAGGRVVMPPLTVVHVNAEASFAELVVHELRWARTIRRIDPAGHAGSVVTHAVPVAVLGAILATLAGGSYAAVAGLLLAILAVRIAQKTIIDRATGADAGPWWLLPARDVLSFAIFLASFMGDTVVWGGRRYRVRRGGAMSELQGPV